MNVGNIRYQKTAVVQSDSTIHNPPLLGLTILTEGTLKYINELGVTVTAIFPAAAAGGCYPHDFWGNIRKVFATDTTLDDIDMLAIVPATP